MFKMLQKLLIGITMSLGVLLVALVGIIGGYLKFGYDTLTTWVQGLDWGDKAAELGEQISTMMKNEQDYLSTVGVWMFSIGVVILGGIVVFGILAAIFKKKSA